MYGHLYEAVVLNLLNQGGTFKRKRVSEDGSVTATEDFQQEKLELLPFKRVEQLGELKGKYPLGAYCKPSSFNFSSLDAIILLDTLVQCFAYKKGNHGYKLRGLETVDGALKSAKYKV